MEAMTRTTTQVIEFSLDSKGTVLRRQVDITIRYDDEIDEWVLTEEAHKAIDNAKREMMGYVPTLLPAEALAPFVKERRLLEEVVMEGPADQQKAILDAAYNAGFNMRGTSGPKYVGNMRYDSSVYQLRTTRVIHEISTSLSKPATDSARGSDEQAGV